MYAYDIAYIIICIFCMYMVHMYVYLCLYQDI